MYGGKNTKSAGGTKTSLLNTENLQTKGLSFGRYSRCECRNIMPQTPNAWREWVSLIAGARLSHYEILEPIGSGGMGDVCKAKDTRLDRLVAIKVLRDVPGKAELTQRFKREARVIAALNHPHICTLYDVGRDDDMDYLVMEYVDGQTLAHRLERGPLPLHEVLKYATQIADALDRAHRQGVTHRDLKPSNIMLTKSEAKLLDFGLAKLKQNARSSNALSSIPTNAGVTAEGTILGTLQYMAPEQFEGIEADARTDIFAFGAVLYEMTTGKKAFEGESQASVIAAILDRDPPPISTLQPMTPPQLDHVVGRCLTKPADDRWQTASDLGHELTWIAENVSRGRLGETPEVVAHDKRGRQSISWSAAALIAVIVGLIGGISVWMLKSGTPMTEPAVVRLAVTLPPGEQATAGTPMAVSANGRQLAYISKNQLFLRTLNSLGAKAIALTEGAQATFFSPNGQWIGFFAQGKLRKVSVTGGISQTLSDAIFGVGGSWGTDDTIYFAPSSISPIWKIPASGGSPQQVTTLERSKGEVSHRWPQILPGGKALLFTTWTGPGWDERHLHLQILETGERRVLAQGASTGRYVSSGHLVYSHAETLLALPFDLARLQAPASPPVPLELQVREVSQGAEFALSDDGVLAYVSGNPQGYVRRLVWVDRKGIIEPLPAPPRAYDDPALSPDGRQAAVAITAGTSGIWIYDFSRATLTPLTTMGSAQAPFWTPDGKRIVYRETRSGFRNLFWKPADGSGEEERLTTSENLHTVGSFTPDGKWLAFREQNPVTNDDIWLMPLDGDRKPQVFLKTPFGESNPRFSPDGHWLAYTSNESGRNEVYVRRFPDPRGKWQISTE